MDRSGVIDLANWLWLCCKYHSEWGKAKKHARMEAHLLPNGAQKMRILARDKSAAKSKSFTDFLYLVKVVALKPIYGRMLDRRAHERYSRSCPREAYVTQAPDGRVFLVGLRDHAEESQLPLSGSTVRGLQDLSIAGDASAAAPPPAASDAPGEQSGGDGAVITSAFTRLSGAGHLTVQPYAWRYARASVYPALQSLARSAHLLLDVLNLDTAATITLKPPPPQMGGRPPASAATTAVIQQMKRAIDEKLVHCNHERVEVKDEAALKLAKSLLDGQDDIIVDHRDDVIHLFGDAELVEELRLNIEIKQEIRSATVGRVTSDGAQPPGSDGAGYPVSALNQPHGDLNTQYINEKLPGYEGSGGTIILHYSFLPGIQGAGHPKPGTAYEGASFKAYLPNTPEGQTVSTRLREAFKKQMTFTVGWSAEHQRDDMVVWRDIPHKTEWSGGMRGYPDSGYMKTVSAILKSKGVGLSEANSSDTQL